MACLLQEAVDRLKLCCPSDDSGVPPGSPIALLYGRQGGDRQALPQDGICPDMVVGADRDSSGSCWADNQGASCSGSAGCTVGIEPDADSARASSDILSERLRNDHRGRPGLSHPTARPGLSFVSEKEHHDLPYF